MWPRLTNIATPVYENLKSRTDLEKTSKLNAWVRVFSGATKGDNRGLILSSNNNFALFKAAGQTSATIYGSSDSTGTIGNDWNGKGVGGANDRALRPSPLVVGLSIKEGKDQISRECELELKCFSLAQMEKLQTYFLEPGYSVCVEWGWNTEEAGIKMIKLKGKEAGILSQATGQNLDYNKLHDIRVASKGDYDSFLGFIVGGTVSSEGETFNVSVKLRGAPGLPTYLQSQAKIQKQDEKGVITDNSSPTLFATSDTEDTKIPPLDRRFRAMFNKLPSQRQTSAMAKGLQETIPVPTADDFINFDEAITKNLGNYIDPEWYSSASDTIQVKSGIGIKKEKLFSKNKYISLDLAVKILNLNGALQSYKIGNKYVSLQIDISTAKIGAFPYMFSTKPESLVIPGDIPDFSAYFLNTSNVSQQADGVLSTDANPSLPPVSVPAGSISFVQKIPLTPDMDGSGLKEKENYWGYLKNLYVNFDMFISKITQSNKNIREILLDILNEMSSAAPLWNFQIIEQVQPNEKTTEQKVEAPKPEPKPFENGAGPIVGAQGPPSPFIGADAGLTQAVTGKPPEDKTPKSSIILTVIDENWIGENPNKVPKSFDHTGVNSPFLESSLDISVPAEMANQIVSKRLGYATQPDAHPITLGGFFESGMDLFMTKNEKENPSEEHGVENKDANTKDAKPQTEREKLNEEINSFLETQNLVQVQSEDYGTYIRNADGTYASQEQIDKYKELTSTTKFIEADKKDNELANTNLNNNTDKIDVVPNVSLTDHEFGKDDVSPANFKTNFQIFCLKDTAYFDRLKQDAINIKGGLSHPLPIKYKFKTLGISGIRRGDTFHINGIPKKYATDGIFQVTQVDHNISGMMWTTEVTGDFRAQQTINKVKAKEVKNNSNH